MAAEKKAKEREKAKQVERQKEEAAKMAAMKALKGGSYRKQSGLKHQEV